MTVEDITTVDYHTAGEPFRIVTGGVPSLEGRTILEQRRWAREHLDEVRKLLVNEPRGHADMYGCFPAIPESDDADLGVVFFHNAGYSTACGHGTIALVTWALDTGQVPVTGAETRVVVDVPSGRLETVAHVTGGKVRSVRFRNVPSYVHERDLAVVVASRRLSVAVAYGGAFYGLLDAAAVGCRVQPEDLAQLIEWGRAIKAAVESEHDIAHPEQPEITGIYGIVFTDGPRNVAVFADGEVDRSPCGSGTSARLALLAADAQLAVGEDFVHRSIVDTDFVARVVGGTRVAGRPAVVTEVEGSAYRTGDHRFVLDPDDPLGTGFLLR
jgi:proline racemase